MMQESLIRDVFDRWEQVWNEGRLDLASDCVAPVYTRHEPPGPRQVTPAEYAAEIAARQQERPNTHIVVYDHAISGDRVWVRWTWHWTNPATGQTNTQSGLQVYRVEDGKLAETWLAVQGVGSTWPDSSGQEHWLSAHRAHQ
jgi:predicted SnoaL-like aldol condensation-catalyzing enzyme